MAALPISWPVAERQPAESIDCDPPPPLGFLAGAFGATLGPELSRIAGVRVSVRGSEGPQADLPMLLIGRLPVRAGALQFAIDMRCAAVLMERLYGGRQETLPTPVGELPPASGSWLAFARLIAGACQQAATGAGCAAAGTLAVPARPMEPDPEEPDPDIAPCSYAVDVDGVRGRVLAWPIPAARKPRAGAPAVSAADLRLWRERVQALALSLDLPVTVRLSDTRVAMARIAALRPGDVIPIAAPRHISLMVAGRRFAQLPLPGAASRHEDGQ